MSKKGRRRPAASATPEPESGPAPEPARSGPPPGLFGLIVCLLCSGAAGLIYETVWTRQLGYYFSGTAVTSCLVLSAFMGGMAIGSSVAGRLEPRSPLTLYGYLELALALTGGTYPLLIDQAGATYLKLAEGVDAPATLFAVRFVLFAALLTVPAVLMGATLPLVVRLVVARPEMAGRGLGLLYAMNSLGGVAGCLLAGFVLIETCGLSLTSNAGAALNLVAAGVALRLRGRLEAGVTPVAVAPEATPDAPRQSALLVVLAVSGFTAMAYEVLWARMLPLILGSSTYSFALMLATFVTGVTLGSLAYNRFGAWLGEPVRVVAVAQVAIGLWVLLTMPAYRWLAWPFVFVRSSVAASFATFQLMALFLNACVMFVPAVLFGLGFPAAVQAATRARGVSRAVGDLYAANTVGNVAGSMAAGLVLIPTIGTPITFQLCALANLVSGLALAPGLLAGLTARSRVVALASLVLLVVPASTREWLPRLAIGGFSRIKKLAWPDAQRLVQAKWRHAIEFLEEDTTGTVVVTEKDKVRALWVNGKVDASNAGDMDTQLFLSLLPVTMLERPKSVFVLGLGSGVTAGAALLDPGIEEVQACEISQGVLDAAHYFDDVNFKPWGDKRFRCAVDDGRHFLATHPRTYDVITMEPSNPWMAGISSLYTREFLSLCKSRLAPEGLMVQWTHLYEIDQHSVTTIARTFQETFPHVRAFLCGFDLIMVGANSEKSLDTKILVERMLRRARLPRIKAALEHEGYTTPFTFLAGEIFDSRTLAQWTGRGLTLSDDHPELEFSAPVAYYDGVQVTPPRDHLPLAGGLLETYLAGRMPDTRELESWARLKLRQAQVFGGARTLLALGSPSDPTIALLAGKFHLAAKEPSAALPLLESALQARPDDLETARAVYQAARLVEDMQASLVKPRTYPSSRAVLATLRRLDASNRHLDVDDAELAIAARDLPAALAALKRCEDSVAKGVDAIRSGTTLLWIALGRLYLSRSDLAAAKEATHHALALEPTRDEAIGLMQEIAELERR